jgi:cobalt-zinc-cadmium efflux system outer membrane protein
VGQDEVSPRDLQVITPEPAPAELSLRDAIDLALSYDLGFRQTVRELLTARSIYYVARQRWQADAFGIVERSGNGETLDERGGGLSFTYSALTGADFSVVAELDRVEGEETERTLSLSLRQPLIAGAGRASPAYEELRSAQSRYREALLVYFTQRQQLVEGAISAYSATAEREQVVTITELSVQLAEQAVRDAELRLEKGLIVEIDLMRAQLRLAREQTSAIVARQSFQDAMDGFLALLGLQVGGSVELTTLISAEREEIDLEAAVAQALDLRPELKLIDLGIEDNEAALRIARSDRLPMLDLFGSWQETDNGVREESWLAGLELSVPIASRSLNEDVRRAEWGLLISEQGREAERQQIIRQVRSQVRAARAAWANVENAAQGVEIAKRSLLGAQRMVEEGLRSNRDLLDFQDDLTRSERDLVNSKINHYLALVRLKAAMGVDITQDLPPERMEETAGGPSADASGPAAMDEDGR